MSWLEELTRRFPALQRLDRPAYVVGGAIRDLLMNREPADVDVACLDPLTAAHRVSSRVIRLGNQEHLSAWRVVAGERVYDFAELLEGDIARDLARRDFTVNAMAVDLASGELFDPHQGRGDLIARSVRMVDASNFDDDPLRTLKAVRMAVRHEMKIEPDTLQAIRLRAPRIVDIAAERVAYELSLIFSSGRLREAVALLDATGLASPLGLEPREVLADDVSVAGAYALLVADPRAAGERWRWSEVLVRQVATLKKLVAEHDRIALYDAGEAIAQQLPAVLRALGWDPSLDLPDFSIEPLLSGDEIAGLCGIEPGKEVGRLKRALVEAQIMGEVRGREDAVDLVKRRCR